MCSEAERRDWKYQHLLLLPPLKLLLIQEIQRQVSLQINFYKSQHRDTTSYSCAEENRLQCSTKGFRLVAAHKTGLLSIKMLVRIVMILKSWNGCCEIVRTRIRGRLAKDFDSSELLADLMEVGFKVWAEREPSQGGTFVTTTGDNRTWNSWFC